MLKTNPASFANTVMISRHGSSRLDFRHKFPQSLAKRQRSRDAFAADFLLLTLRRFSPLKKTVTYKISASIMQNFSPFMGAPPL